MAFLLLTGHIGIPQAILGFFLPVLAGNVIGGSAIFAALAWGQVKDEIKERRERQAHERVEKEHQGTMRMRAHRARRTKARRVEP